LRQVTERTEVAVGAPSNELMHRYWQSSSDYDLGRRIKRVRYSATGA
jgi:hypothetical protein